MTKRKEKEPLQSKQPSNISRYYDPKRLLRLEANVDGSASKGNKAVLFGNRVSTVIFSGILCTHEVVSRAADGLVHTLAGSQTDEGDRTAGKAAMNTVSASPSSSLHTPPTLER